MSSRFDPQSLLRTASMGIVALVLAVKLTVGQTTPPTLTSCCLMAQNAKAAAAEPAPRRILLIGGPPDGHRPGTHEYAKSVLLLRDHLAGLPDAAAGRFVVETSENGWPENPAAIERADTIALFSSGSDRREQDHPLLVGDHMEEVAKAMARGCGLVTFHYSTFAPNRIGPRILEWTGGYFDYESGPGPRNWYSRINTWEARLDPATPAHPISQGVEPFTIKEEIYWRIRFRDDDPRLVPILKTVAPGEPEPQTVAWAVERADGGRGFGFTGGHFFAHWQNESFRQLMANAVLWTAKAEPALQAAARPDAKQSGTARPNVVVILADDLGWGDVTCYNPESKIVTPRIDALAADGLRMTNAYTPASVCSPTRYGLLTGRYPWRTWHKEGVLYHYDPSLIRPGRVTLGTLCQGQGYATAAVGKWHVGLDWQPQPGDPGDWMVGQPIRYADKKQTAARIDFTKPITVGPREIGFDRFFGSVHQGRDDHVVRDHLRIPGFVAKPSNHDDLFVEESIAFIEDCRRQDPAKPFLLYLPLGSPHHGQEVPPRLKGKSGDGVRGDRVLWVDESVGRILDVLEKQGIADETIVIFTSDNGASDNRRSPGGNPEHHPNGPYRGFKTDVWDGGYRVPFIVRWPGTIKPGSTAEQVVCLTDVLATLAEVEGVPLPAWAGEDSYSMLSAWKGGSEPVRESLVLQSYKGVLSIREGRWKLVLGTEGSGGHRGVTPEWTPIQTGWERVDNISVGQLYDLESDPYERTNLFDSQPAVVARLRGKLDKMVTDGRSRPLAPADATSTR